MNIAAAEAIAASATTAVVDTLTVIPPADWPELRDLYVANWPHNLVAYHTVDNFIQWHRRDPSIRNLTFYSLNGDWRKDGTYVIVVSETERNYLIRIAVRICRIDGQ